MALNKIGVKKKHQKLSQAEEKFMEKCRRHPELSERFEAILKIAEDEEKKGSKVDEIEEILIEEVRRLGNETMRRWSSKKHWQIEEEMRAAQMYCGKKKDLGGGDISEKSK